MTHETMTVHRAMVELKTIDKRINKEIESAAFCTSAKVNMKKLGSSCDWDRERFTMDEGCSEAVKEVF